MMDASKRHASALIHTLFEQQAILRPDAVALIWEDQQLTYASLNARANKIAHALLSFGIGIEDRVGLFAERSAETVIGMLAILKAGGCYVPLDPSYPPERLALMAGDSGMVAVLTVTRTQHDLPISSLPVVLLDTESGHSDLNPSVRDLSPHNLAYVVYTSGSTGRPKGVMVEHRNVLSLTLNESYAPIDPSDCIAHCASPSFDAATWEVWGALLNGARILIVPKRTALDPETFGTQLLKHGVSSMFLTVGLFNEYADNLEAAFSQLEYLMVGGDTLPPASIARALGKGGRPEHLLNVYGPTETTTFATHYEIKSVSQDAESIPIGKGIENTEIYILDDNRKPAPVGATGEIFIGGRGVARGYLNQPDLTAERFVANPFSKTSERMYRSGDLGYLTDERNVEFLGRNDLQVKLRGFRIELPEIEIAMGRFPGVSHAAAAVRVDSRGAKRLFGYVVPDPTAPNDTLLIERLRKYLGERLPPYMVPTVIVQVTAMPLNQNGKVDRLVLPVPDSRPELGTEYVAPSTVMEQRLSLIWSETLKIDRVGVDDNFFELGGDSLLGIETISRIAAELNTELHFMSLFEYPTLRDLARRIDVGPA